MAEEDDLPRRTPSPEDALGHDGLELAVAGHGLAHHGAGFPSAPLDEDGWQALLRGVRGQRTCALLDAAIADGALAATTSQAREARQWALQAALADLAVEARLVQTSDILGEAGIEHRILKGITTAARVYPDRRMRSYGDVDVLVPGTAFDAAVALLEKNGGTRRYAQARPGFDRRFSKGTSFWMPDGISVDLHRTFVLGPYGFTVDLAGIFSRVDRVVVGGREVPCLEMVDAAVHACMHAALGDWPPRLVPMRDVVQFVADARVDGTALIERAREWRCEAVVARAVTLAQQAYGLQASPLTSWASGHRARRWEQRAIALYGPGHTYRRQALGALRFVPSGSAKLSYALALSFPSRSYLVEREGSVVRRGLRALGATGMSTGQAGDRRVRAYLGSRRLFYATLTLARACFDGVWLGLLDRSHCESVDRHYYDGQAKYVDPGYNQLGLWRWEREDVDAHFRQCRQIAVLGAGGGREVVALRREGFDVDGFECHEGLRHAGNELLRSIGLPPTIFPMPRDRWPDAPRTYDGVVIGWGAYMLISERRDRIDLLASVRSRLPDNGPVLLSFFLRNRDSTYFGLSARVANLVRRVRGRSAVDIGASLAPNRVHYLTITEVAEELRLAGFTLARHGADEYGHAVGLAVPGPH